MALGFSSSLEDCRYIPGVLSGYTHRTLEYSLVNVVVVLLFDRDRISLVSRSDGLFVIVKLLAWSARIYPADPMGWHATSFRVLARSENHNRLAVDLASIGCDNRTSGIYDTLRISLESWPTLSKCPVDDPRDRRFRFQLDNRDRLFSRWLHPICRLHNRVVLQSEFVAARSIPNCYSHTSAACFGVQCTLRRLNMESLE